MEERKNDTSIVQSNLDRRSFIKKAVLGAVFAAPVIESLTKSDILVKSALAQTGPVPPGFVISVVVVSGPGTGSATPPPPIGANPGDDVTVTFEGNDGSCIVYLLDNGSPVFVPQGTWHFDYVLTNILADHQLEVSFSPC